MKEKMINIQEIENSFKKDISQRGINLLVYDYFGRVTRLKDVEISYDIHGKYRPPKEYVHHRKEKSCIIS